ncbi:cyclin-dependent kinase inhibitor 1C-like [Trachypithecus francoisi]|uniref:cyclin-dependent kinase inhibitor 1C-like n=1 Tax=Trachypithecus francoisi TaxID=54180 RepID=UPI00141BA6B0|nr:cyclin-dependent kinase inhibitor 1C-like [Trachypithecus francoisi]
MGARAPRVRACVRAYTLEGKVKLKAREQRDRREPLPPPRAMTDAAEAAFSVRTPPNPSSRRAPCPPPLARPSPQRWRVPAPSPPAAPGARRARGAGRREREGGGRGGRAASSPDPRPRARCLQNSGK